MEDLVVQGRLRDVMRDGLMTFFTHLVADGRKRLFVTGVALAAERAMARRHVAGIEGLVKIHPTVIYCRMKSGMQGISDRKNNKKESEAGAQPESRLAHREPGFFQGNRGVGYRDGLFGDDALQFDGDVFLVGDFNDSERIGADGDAHACG